MFTFRILCSAFLRVSSNSLHHSVLRKHGAVRRVYIIFGIAKHCFRRNRASWESNCLSLSTIVFKFSSFEWRTSSNASWSMGAPRSFRSAADISLTPGNSDMTSWDGLMENSSHFEGLSRSPRDLETSLIESKSSFTESGSPAIKASSK